MRFLSFDMMDEGEEMVMDIAERTAKVGYII
jgi:hypothetical protein